MAYSQKAHKALQQHMTGTMEHNYDIQRSKIINEYYM